ncbi:hypothetical protein Tco_0174034 [Tanacetum coccineum]
MGRDTVQLETTVSTISQEYLLEFTFEYDISEGLHPKLPGRGDRIVDFPEGKVGYEKVFPTIVDWCISAPKDGMPAGDTYSMEDVMDLFNLISAPNPAIVKTGTRQRATHEVPLLTATASRVIDMEDVDETESQIPAKTSREAPPVHDTMTMEVAPEVNLEQEVTAMRPLVNKRRRKRDQRKSLVAMGLGSGSTVPTPIPQETPADVIGPDPLSHARPQSIPERDIAQSSKGTTAAEDPESEKSTSFTSLAGSSGGIYQSGWGVTNNCRLDTPEACQDMVDHSVPLGYFSELRHLPNPEFLSQLRRKATAKIARRDQRIQARDEEIKKLDEEVQSLRVVEMEVHGLCNRTQNLETLLEAEVDMKKAADAKNTELVSTLQSQITGEEKIKAAFEEFKRCEDDRVGSRCAKIDARLDALSIDFDEELYLHMLTTIVGRRWVIGHGLRLAIWSGAGGEVKLDLANIEAYDPEAEGKFTATMQALKDLKYPLIVELEKLKDAPMDIIMASLYLESDTGEDAPQWIRDLRPSSSQLKILVYLEVRDPEDPWAFKEELLLKDAIAANVSRAEKKRKCRIVCCTHGVGSAHQARSDGIPVSVPTAPQGLQILLKDAASQTELPEDGASPRLVRSKSLPAMYNLDWP